MPTFHVEESIHIAAPPTDVFRIVRDFKSWPTWSPWLLAEPDTTLHFSDDGTTYSWDGRVTGAGAMTVLDETPDRSIDARLTFLRPWKSINTTAFRLSAVNDGTKLTWTMRGTLPFFLFFMKRKLTAYVAADYRRGLAMLKDVIETGDKGFTLDFLGTSTIPECHYLGLRRDCTIAEISTSMSEAMEELTRQADAAGIQPSAAPFSIYQDWNPVAGTATYIIGIPIAEALDLAPSGCTIGTIPETPTFQVRLTGAYRHLGNAWAAGMMHQQARMFPSNSKISPFEIYQNDPERTPEAELITTVHLPAKHGSPPGN